MKLFVFELGNGTLSKTSYPEDDDGRMEGWMDDDDGDDDDDW